MRRRGTLRARWAGMAAATVVVAALTAGAAGTAAADDVVGGGRLASGGTIIDLPPGVPQPPPLRDNAWVLADLDSGQVIAARAPHARLRPASTLKTLTALTLIPKIPPTQTIVATAQDVRADGTRVGLVPGLPYSAATLFDALLMASGNDAAYALARAGGGRDTTLAAMNAQAAALDARDTVAKDPSGLDAPGQTSSAYDLALIARAAMQLPEFRRYVTTKRLAFPGAMDPVTKKRATYIINNHNRLLYNYPGTIGIKNGYTEAASHTFISAVHRGSKTYLLTEMDGRDASWRPQAAMYDWAFKYGDQARPVGVLVDPGTAPSPTTSAPAEGLSAVAGAGAAAAALPPAALITQGASPWVGGVGLAAIAGLVVLLATRPRRRRSGARASRGHRPRH